MSKAGWTVWYFSFFLVFLFMGIWLNNSINFFIAGLDFGLFIKYGLEWAEEEGIL